MVQNLLSSMLIVRLMAAQAVKLSGF